MRFGYGSGSSIFSNCRSGFRIRIPDLDPEFDDLNLKKFTAGTPKLQEKLSALKKENIQHFKTWKFCTFFYFCGSFLPSWIRIRTHNLNADPDPDPATQINADPQSPCQKPSILPDRLPLHHSPETSAVLHSEKKANIKKASKDVPLDGKYRYSLNRFLCCTKFFSLGHPPCSTVADFNMISLRTKWKGKTLP